MSDERYAGQIDEQQIESTKALVERINAQLPKRVQLLFIDAGESGLDCAMLMAVDYDEDGEETGDWGWHVDLPADDKGYLFTYAGNFSHDQEGYVEPTDEALINKIVSLEF